MAKKEDYKPKYHFSCKKGWINDPNGFVYFNNEYHLFFQHFPGGSWPGLMTWGHAVSKDLVKWEELPIAIKPTSSYDPDGCWSGSSFVHKDKLYLMYTGNNHNNGDAIQTQNIVISKDGRHFKKYKNNPVISPDSLPDGGSYHDFRDPSIFKYRNRYYVLLGNQGKDKGASLLTYKSTNLKNWKFNKRLFDETKLGFMIECPSSALIDDKRVVIMSPQGLAPKGDDFWNMYSSVYSINKPSLNKIDISNFKEIDHGLDFYAPHIISDGNIMIAWMQLWERKFPLTEMKNKWCGIFTLPRKLSLKGNKLIQTPVEGLDKYFVEKFDKIISLEKDKEILVDNGVFKKIHLEVPLGSLTSLKVFKEKDKYMEIAIDNDVVRVDRRHSFVCLKSEKPEKSNCEYREVHVKGKTVSLDIYLDRIALEVYINNGEETLSFTCYHPIKADDITLMSSNNKEIKMKVCDFKDE